MTVKNKQILNKHLLEVKTRKTYYYFDKGLMISCNP